jgi:hypothetical protein
MSGWGRGGRQLAFAPHGHRTNQFLLILLLAVALLADSWQLVAFVSAVLLVGSV